ncbi:MAG: galactokinase [Cellvibrionaceae bacterium]|jgi:galactokinase
MSLQKLVTQKFEEKFGEAPAFVVRAPGRVNLIGGHTDYNDGFVMPMAIDRAVWLAIRPRVDGIVAVTSLEMEDPIEFEIANLGTPGQGWGEYLKGVTWALLEDGFDLSGWEGVMTSDVPLGAGLSSSAAIEMATAMAYMALSDTPWDAPHMAKIGQRAENDWVGAKTGIMDQMISASGAADHALMIDCRDLTTKLVPFPANTVVVILDTMTRHTHTGSGYNDRRNECEAAARHYGVSHLRDLTNVALQKGAAGLDKTYLRRAIHIVGENGRVLQAVKAMEAGDAHLVGLFINASHDSLRDNFEVTNRDLDLMAALAQESAGCYGARMTGGGFGGCVVALVNEEKAESFAKEIAKNYQEITGLEPQIYICKATAGAAILKN